MRIIVLVYRVVSAFSVRDGDEEIGSVKVIHELSAFCIPTCWISSGLILTAALILEHSHWSMRLWNSPQIFYTVPIH